MDINAIIFEKLKEKYPEAEEWYQRAQLSKIDLEEYLYKTRKADLNEILNIKESVSGYAKTTFGIKEISQDVLNLVPENSAKLYQIIAFDKKDSEIFIGVVNPQNTNLEEILGFLRNSLKLEPKIFVISIEDFFKALRYYHNFSAELRSFVEQFRKGKPISEEETTFFGETASAQDAPVIRIAELIIREAVNSFASDIHLEPLMDRMRLRFRLNGELKTVGYLPKDLHYQIANRIKVLSKLKLDETRIPQDGRIRLLIEGREIDLRIGVLPTIEGEKITIRILDPVVGLKNLLEIGVSEYYLKKIKAAKEKPFGLFLVTGPTGSGKTTTLYALIQEINKENVNIISLEDPVEYRIDGINQSQVLPEIGYAFATGLREILRQDPDIILVGEIRDRETAELAIHSALTGQLVFATLHTNDAVSSITRLIDIGIERFLISPTLQLLIAQRLARKLCDCKEKFEAEGELEKLIEDAIETLPSVAKEKFQYKKPYTIYRANGCDKCNKKGFVGRTGLFEIIEINEEIKKSISTGESEIEMRKHLKNQDFISLRQDGVLKALDGSVVLEEIIKIT